MLNRFEWERYAKSTAARANLSVVWHDKKMAATDGKSMWLPYMPADATEDDWKKLRHYVAHEVDHVLYTDFDEYAKLGVDIESFLAAIYNSIEDVRIERKGALEYEGDRLNSNDVHLMALTSIAKGATEKLRNPALPPQDREMMQKILSLVAWVNREYNDIYPSAALVQKQVEAPLDAQGRAWFDKLVAGPYSAVLKSTFDEAPTEGTIATRKLAERIFKEVYGGDPDEEREQHKKKGKPEKGQKGEEGKPEESEGEGEEGDEGEGEGEEAGEKEGEGKKGDKEDSKERPPITVKWQEFSKDAKPLNGIGRQDKHLDFSTYRKSGRAYVPKPLSEHVIKDHTLPSVLLEQSSSWKSSITNALSSTNDAFSHRVRQVLQIRDKDRYQYGLKRGKLHGSSLHRVVVKDAPGYNERIFKRKIENDVLNSAVSVLVDMSGSMSGNKYAHAAAAAVMLSEVIGNVLHVPVEVNTFSDSSDKPREHIVRRFDERLVAKDTMLSRLALAPRSGMAGNPDGDAIAWAYDRILPRKEKRKVLIVLSDGSPASYTAFASGGGDLVEYTEQVIRDIERSNVRIVGIGIMDDNVKRFYKEHYVIKSASELENVLLSVVEKQLR